MPNSILSLLFLMAIGQGLFLAAALLLSGQPAVRGANRLLAALLLVCAAIIGHAWLGANGLYLAYPHSALAVATLGLLAGPLLYLYLGSMLFDRPLGRRQLVHIAPFAIATLALLPFYLQPAEAKLAWMLGRTGPPWYLAVAAVAKLAFFLGYIRASHLLVKKIDAGPLVHGLRRLLIVWLVGGVLSVAALAMEFADVPMAISADAVGALALLCFVYATAFLAIRLPLGYRPQPEPMPKPRYANSLMPEEARSGFLAKLTHSMEQRELYRNGELKLDELAAELAMTGHELSQLINEACGVNFQDYLNRYRVEALKLSLLSPANADATILDLAMAAGFASKSALNRAFKKHTGMTPSEFRRAESSFATQSGG
ncbi:helix-turn-helix domain-containing protein [Massilia sp. GCM10020059]|uniref:Helix-turn-helix domain-containing protein n=1 Tax=Massilia agrisoli TaxID=2892444 RepID=A0ABS8IZI1_9BURK|nr:helix-turn-helix domain-containing protein [Massilia agrisoli]